MLKESSPILFAQPSFESGIAGPLDLWGVFTDYNTSSTPEKADAAALAADWCVVGQDILDALQLVFSEK